MHKTILLVSLLFLIGFTQSGHSQSRGVHRIPLGVTTEAGFELALYKESHALLIGVSEYLNWPRLDSIPSELDLVEEALIEQQFNVVRLNNPKGRELPDGIKDFIDQYGYEKENRLLIFYSGHGHSVDKSGFLVPADSPLPGEPGFRQKTVPMSQVMSWARDMVAKHALFVFDSCFSGSLFQSRSLPEDNERYIRQATAEPVRQFITAGSANQEVPAVSTFTPALVRAINGDGDMNNDGYVTGSELGVHLSQLVPRYVDQTPQYGKIRDYDLAQGDIVFFKQETHQSTREAQAPDNSLEALLWQSAERGNVVAEYQAYIDQFPTGTFAQLAQARIDRLTRNQADTGKPIKADSASPTVSSTGLLTVRVSPSEAQIRIMNIVPVYQDGIELEMNKRYDVLITKKGFKSDRRWIRLTQQNQLETITLERNTESSKPRTDYAAPDRNTSGKAFDLYVTCEGGNPSHCNELAWLYQSGRGVERDEERAFLLFQKSCDGGAARGCNGLGWAYQKGLGVAKDNKRAFALYQQACESGNISACKNLGFMYENGSAVEKDFERAVTLYQQACDGGNASGCKNLGVLVENGRGVVKDSKRAVALYQQACEGGDAGGCKLAGE